MNNNPVTKQVDISISLQLNEGIGSVGKHDIEKALSSLGVISSVTVCPYTVKSAKNLKKSVWLQIDCIDMAKPYLLATNQFLIGDREITNSELDFLKKHGVCVHMAGGYDEDEFGTLEPVGQVGHTFASVSAFIETRGFPIDPNWPFDITCGVSDGQGEDEVLGWLKIMIPENGPF